MRNPLLATRLFGSPLLAHPGKAAAVAEIFLGPGADMPVQIVQHSVQPMAGIDGDRMAAAYERENLNPFPVFDGVGLIKISGSLVSRGQYIGQSSGATSYHGIQASARRALDSDVVRAVVFEVDSFGGEVQGCFETADLIAELSAAKPTMAIVANNCCSAAYLLASQARRISAPIDGDVGSIGAVTMHIDQSRKLDQDGVAVTFVHAGARKVEGNAAEPLPDALRAEMQTRVDGIRDRFADVVARGRPGFNKAAALATEAACYQGPEALRLGLTDALAEPSAAFAAFRAAVNRG